MPTQFQSDSNLVLGGWLKQQRELRNLDLEEVARAVEIPKEFLEKLEDGHTGLPLNILAKLHRGYKYEAGDLVCVLLEVFTREPHIVD